MGIIKGKVDDQGRCLLLEDEMQVIHGEIGDIHGEMRTHGNFGFVNAAVLLAGNSWSLECNLSDFSELHGVPGIASFVRRGIDAIWVIGRLKAVFGSWIEPVDGEKSILYEGFVAHSKADGICVPFVLTDHYLRTAFMFGDTLDDPQTKRAIARSFYQLLLENPDDLLDYEFRKEHIGAGIAMVGGIIRGQVQYDEEV